MQAKSKGKPASAPQREYCPARRVVFHPGVAQTAMPCTDYSRRMFQVLTFRLHTSYALNHMFQSADKNRHRQSSQNIPPVTVVRLRPPKSLFSLLLQDIAHPVKCARPSQQSLYKRRIDGFKHGHYVQTDSIASEYPLGVRLIGHIGKVVKPAIRLHLFPCDAQKGRTIFPRTGGIPLKPRRPAPRVKCNNTVST